MKKKTILLVLTACLSVCIFTGCMNTQQSKQSSKVNMFRSIDFGSADVHQKNIPNVNLQVIKNTDSDDLHDEISEDELNTGDNIFADASTEKKDTEEAKDIVNTDTVNQEEQTQIAGDSDKNNTPDQSEDNANQKDSNTGNQDKQTDNESDNTQGDPQSNDDKETISPITMARAQFIMNANPYVSKENAIYYVQLFEKYQQSIVPYMEVEALMGIARIESVYYEDVTSVYAGPDGKHFRGLMQLHEDYESIYGYGPDDLFDPDCNIECACRLLKDTADRVPAYNYDQTYLICAYHQGPVSIEYFDYSYPDLVYYFADQIKALYPTD